MRLTEGDHKKRRYQVVAMKPIDHSEALSGGGDKTRYESRKDYTDTNTDKDKPLAQKTGEKVPGTATTPSQ
jgi:hypothetical protein